MSLHFLFMKGINLFMSRRNPYVMVLFIFTLAFFYLFYKLKVDFNTGNLASFLIFSGGFALVINSAIKKFLKQFKFKEEPLDRRKLLDDYTNEQIRLAKERKIAEKPVEDKAKEDKIVEEE